MNFIASQRLNEKFRILRGNPQNGPSPGTLRGLVSVKPISRWVGTVFPGPKQTISSQARRKRDMKRMLAAGAALLMMTAAPAFAKTTIGVSMALFDDNFLTILRQAMAEHAKTIPDVDIQFQDAQADIGKQLSQVQNFVSQKVDAI